MASGILYIVSIGEKIQRPMQGAVCSYCRRIPVWISHQKFRSRQIEAFNAMYKLLKQLFGNSKTFGGLGIAKIVLFLWNQNFQEDPLYEHIMSWLLLQGSEQQDWFPCETHLASNQRPLENQLSGLRISKSRLQTINRAAISDVKASLSLVRAEKLGKDLSAQIVGAFEKHNALIREYLGETSRREINDSIDIRALLIPCEGFLSTINTGGYELEQRDIQSLLSCLEQLASLVCAKDMV